MIFYIKDMNVIIETHGLQHYRVSFARMDGRTLDKEQENVRRKFNNAIENGVRNYIVIDCRDSELQFIKNSFIESEFADFFGFTCVDWQECFKFACSSLMHEAWEMWNSGTKSAVEIAKKLKVSRTTVVRYLKSGSEA